MSFHCNNETQIMRIVFMDRKIKTHLHTKPTTQTHWNLKKLHTLIKMDMRNTHTMKRKLIPVPNTVKEQNYFSTLFNSKRFQQATTLQPDVFFAYDFHHQHPVFLIDYCPVTSSTVAAFTCCDPLQQQPLFDC